MAQLTLGEVRRFVRNAQLSVQELDALAEVVQAARATALEKEQNLARALQELDIHARNLAEHCGIQATSTRDLIDKLDQLFGRRMVSSGRKVNRITSEIRKPYLDPFNPTELFFLAKNRPVPAWAQKLYDQGWSREELHFKRVATALRARQLPVEHDFLAIHASLVAAEQGD